MLERIGAFLLEPLLELILDRLAELFRQAIIKWQHNQKKKEMKEATDVLHDENASTEQVDDALNDLYPG